jgi:hypothetical protein
MLRSGGAIVARSDRSDIANLADLQNKRIAVTDPDSLFSYQAQLRTLSDRGLNIHLLSSQIIFTQSRLAVLQEVYSGRADVGFVEAGRLEDAEDAGRVPPNALRSIEPITNHILSGSQLFPFEVSTLLYPNSPLIMHSSVSSDVQGLVTVALLSINSSSTMAVAGDYQGWRPAANYLEVLAAMRLAGIYDPETEQCARVSTLRDSIVCPEQYTSKSELDLATSCDSDDLVCPTPTSVNDTYICICSACKPSCGNNEIETEPGVCKCRRGFVIMAGKCVPLYAQVLVLVFPILVVLFVLIRLLLKWQQKRSDQMWHIKPHELEFDDPAICLGSGSFGVVLQAEYRGSVVALKSILPRGKKMGSALNKTATSHVQRGGMLSRPGAKSTKHKAGARGGLFASGFDYIEDTYERGLQKLKRALAQAAEAAEAAREETSSTEHSAKNKSFTKDAGSASASGRRARHLSAGSRSGRKRTLTTVFQTRAQHEREDFIREMRLLSKLRHPCVATVIGAVLEPNCPPILVMEHMDLGSLHSLLHNPNMDVDDETMRMMMLDIVHGCRFLHAFEPPVIHGDLKSMVRCGGKRERERERERESDEAIFLYAQHGVVGARCQMSPAVF